MLPTFPFWSTTLHPHPSPSIHFAIHIPSSRGQKSPSRHPYPSIRRCTHILLLLPGIPRTYTAFNWQIHSFGVSRIAFSPDLCHFYRKPQQTLHIRSSPNDRQPRACMPTIRGTFQHYSLRVVSPKPLLSLRVPVNNYYPLAPSSTSPKMLL